MGFLSKFGLAFKAYKKAVSFTSEHRLWGYYILPALINFTILFFIGWVAIAWLGDLEMILSDWIGIGNGESWWQIGLDYFLKILVYLLIAVIFLKLYKYVILILLSPALAFLAEKTQDILHGGGKPFDFQQLVKDIMRGIGMALKNLIVESLILLVLFGLSFIAILSPITTVLIVLVECYFLGLSMMDYRNEYKGLSGKESRKVARKHFGFTIGNGMGVYLLMFVPVFGVLFAPLLAVVAAGLGTCQLEEDRKLI